MSSLSDGQGGRTYILKESLLTSFVSLGETMFSDQHTPNDAFYFGFGNDLSRHIIRLHLELSLLAVHDFREENPPWIWEVSTGDPDTRKQWAPCEIEEVNTVGGLNRPGAIDLDLPKMGQQVINGKNLFWVRVRVREISERERDLDMRPYTPSPRLRKVQVESVGFSVDAVHSQLIEHEFLGISDGSPGQRFRLRMSPVLKREVDKQEQLLVDDGNRSMYWTEVTDFADSEENSRQYTLDSFTGEIRLGPAIRQRDGTIRCFGKVPPRGAKLEFRRYRHGGGVLGNVKHGELETLKSSIPYVRRVSNKRDAYGGLDAQSIEDAIVRAPALLRSRQRAVTADDFEFLVQEKFGHVIDRVKCLTPSEESVKNGNRSLIDLRVIPKVDQPVTLIPKERLTLDRALANEIKSYLDQRRLIGIPLTVNLADLKWVSVQIQAQLSATVRNPEMQQRVTEAVIRRLYRFLNPFVGGNSGNGWSFGRGLTQADIYQCLQKQSVNPGERLEEQWFDRFSVEIFEAREDYSRGPTVRELLLQRSEVIVSARHTVQFI